MSNTAVKTRPAIRVICRAPSKKRSVVVAHVTHIIDKLLNSGTCDIFVMYLRRTCRTNFEYEGRLLAAITKTPYDVFQAHQTHIWGSVKLAPNAATFFAARRLVAHGLIVRHVVVLAKYLVANERWQSLTDGCNNNRWPNDKLTC